MYLFTSWPVCSKILEHIFSSGSESWHTIVWPNMAHLLWKRLFWRKKMILIYFLVSFFVHELFKKNLGSFWWSIILWLNWPKQYFFQKNNLIFVYIWVHSISETFKKSLEWIQTSDDASFSSPIWRTSPGQDFFEKNW